MLETPILFEQIVVLSVLLLLSGFFSSAETALFSISKAKAIHLAKEKGYTNSLIKRMKDDPHRLLSTILIGNNIVNVGASALATAVTLKLVAQYADYCNVFGDPATVAHKFDVLRQHCKTVGRSFDEITRSNNIGILIAPDEASLAAKKEQHPDYKGIIGTPDVVLSQLEEYAAAGSEYLTFYTLEADDIEAIQLIGETVLPYVANL